MTDDQLLRLTGRVSMSLMKSCMQLVKENSKLEKQNKALKQEIASLRKRRMSSDC